MSAFFKISSLDNVTTVTLQSAKDVAYFSRVSINELIEVVKDTSKNSNAEAIVFTSDNPKVFSLGFNPTEFQFDIKTIEEIAFGLRLGQTLVKEIYYCRVPVEFKIDGFCLGAGLEFALSAKKLTLGPHAKLKFPEPKIGIGWFPGYGGIYLMAQKFGLDFLLNHLHSPQYFTPKEIVSAQSKKFEKNIFEGLELALKIAKASCLEDAQDLSTELFLNRIKKQYNK